MIDELGLVDEVKNAVKPMFLGEVVEYTQSVNVNCGLNKLD